jgi:hypothetical protein
VNFYPGSDSYTTRKKENRGGQLGAVGQNRRPSTFNGGYAGSSNRRCLRLLFYLSFSSFNKTIEASQSLTLPRPHDASILSHETLVKTTHLRHPP